VAEPRGLGRHEPTLGWRAEGLGRLELVQIKACLSSIECRNFLNHVIIPHIHMEKLELLDLNRIYSEFISKNQNRKIFFGHE
jgi:hypothetical protein